MQGQGGRSRFGRDLSNILQPPLPSPSGSGGGSSTAKRGPGLRGAFPCKARPPSSRGFTMGSASLPSPQAPSLFQPFIENQAPPMDELRRRAEDAEAKAAHEQARASRLEQELGEARAVTTALQNRVANSGTQLRIAGLKAIDALEILSSSGSPVHTPALQLLLLSIADTCDAQSHHRGRYDCVVAAMATNSPQADTSVSPGDIASHTSSSPWLRLSPSPPQYTPELDMVPPCSSLTDADASFSSNTSIRSSSSSAVVTYTAPPTTRSTPSMDALMHTAAATTTASYPLPPEAQHTTHHPTDNTTATATITSAAPIPSPLRAPPIGPHTAGSPSFITTNTTTTNSSSVVSSPPPPLQLVIADATSTTAAATAVTDLAAAAAAPSWVSIHADDALTCAGGGRGGGSKGRNGGHRAGVFDTHTDAVTVSSLPSSPPSIPPPPPVRSSPRTTAITTTATTGKPTNTTTATATTTRRGVGAAKPKTATFASFLREGARGGIIIDPPSYPAATAAASAASATAMDVEADDPFALPHSPSGDSDVLGDLPVFKKRGDRGCGGNTRRSLRLVQKQHKRLFDPVSDNSPSIAGATPVDDNVVLKTPSPPGDHNAHSALVDGNDDGTDITDGSSSTPFTTTTITTISGVGGRRAKPSSATTTAADTADTATPFTITITTTSGVGGRRAKRQRRSGAFLRHKPPSATVNTTTDTDNTDAVSEAGDAQTTHLCVRESGGVREGERVPVEEDGGDPLMSEMEICEEGTGHLGLMHWDGSAIDAIEPTPMTAGDLNESITDGAVNDGGGGGGGIAGAVRGAVLPVEEDRQDGGRTTATAKAKRPHGDGDDDMVVDLLPRDLLDKLSTDGRTLDLCFLYTSRCADIVSQLLSTTNTDGADRRTRASSSSSAPPSTAHVFSLALALLHHTTDGAIDTSPLMPLLQAAVHAAALASSSSEQGGARVRSRTKGVSFCDYDFSCLPTPIDTRPGSERAVRSVVEALCAVLEREHELHDILSADVDSEGDEGSSGSRGGGGNGGDGADVPVSNPRGRGGGGGGGGSSWGGGGDHVSQVGLVSAEGGGGEVPRAAAAAAARRALASFLCCLHFLTTHPVDRTEQKALSRLMGVSVSRVCGQYLRQWSPLLRPTTDTRAHAHHDAIVRTTHTAAHTTAPHAARPPHTTHTPAHAHAHAHTRIITPLRLRALTLLSSLVRYHLRRMFNPPPLPITTPGPKKDNQAHPDAAVASADGATPCRSTVHKLLCVQASPGQCHHPLGALADGALASLVSQAALDVYHGHVVLGGEGFVTQRTLEDMVEEYQALSSSSSLPCDAADAASGRHARQGANKAELEAVRTEVDLLKVLLSCCNARMFLLSLLRWEGVRQAIDDVGGFAALEAAATMLHSGGDGVRQAIDDVGGFAALEAAATMLHRHSEGLATGDQEDAHLCIFRDVSQLEERLSNDTEATQAMAQAAHDLLTNLQLFYRERKATSRSGPGGSSGACVPKPGLCRSVQALIRDTRAESAYPVLAHPPLAADNA